MLKGSLGASVVLVLPGLACGGADQDISTADVGVLAEPTAVFVESTAIAQQATSEPAATTAQTEPAATTDNETTDAPPAPTDSPVGGFPTGAELVVGFTYTQLPGGKNVPPYLAVWIEDEQGELVETIELWYELSQKGPRWLPDLKRWFRKEEDFAAAGNPDETDLVSSATRLPGAYSLVWDGITTTGPLAAGDYFICIEASRERGPYSLVREPMPIDGSPFVLALPDNEELSDASVSLVA